jgi:hypothetical protein
VVEQATWSEEQEMAVYRPGQKVELKHRPGIIDTIIAYDPYMVPPVILASDAQPRYAEELNVISQPGGAFDWFKPLARVTGNRHKSTRRQQLIRHRA